MTTSKNPKQCKAITKGGSRCKRKALPNSDYCQLHIPPPAKKRLIEKFGPYIGAAAGLVEIIAEILKHGGGFLSYADLQRLSKIRTISSSAAQQKAFQEWLRHQPIATRSKIQRLMTSTSAPTATPIHSRELEATSSADA
jgi:hypothetical protein